MSSASTSAPAPSPSPTRARPEPAVRERITLLGGGDISFGRLVGQMLLKEPERDFFASLEPWIESADLRFANLEGPLSDQGGETGSKLNNLIFTGPPMGAASLARAGFSIVSTANNHAWDYGKKALFETMDNLEREKVRYVGTGRSRERAYAPVILAVEGFRVAFLAVTDIWNQGALARHAGAEYVAGAERETLDATIRDLRGKERADAIVLSYHGGSEYIDEPLTRTKEILRGAIDAGADLVLGHHPHVIQGVEWYHERPIFYSLGNLLMRMHRDHAWTEYGFLARVSLGKNKVFSIEACPYRIFGTRIVPLRGERVHEARFSEHLRAISARVGEAEIAKPGQDGCMKIQEKK